MSLSRPRHPRALMLCLIAWVALLTVSSTYVSAGDTNPETWTVAGRRFERVRVLEVNAATVTITHAGGMVQLELASLPPEMQERFHFEPARAEAWKQEATAGIAATEALKQQELRARQQRAAADDAALQVERRKLASDPSQVELHPEVDLRPVFNEHNLYLKNQGQRPSCTIFAVVSVLEYEYARSSNRSEPLSEEYLIWALRKSRPDVPLNDGYHFREVLDALRDWGIPRRSILPDSFASYLRDEAPPPDAMADAATRRTVTPLLLDAKDPAFLLQCVWALNQEMPVIIGIKWPSQRTLEQQNLIKDQVPQTGAGHAVTLVGYRSDGTPESLQFIFRNSYGPQWGLGGYGLLAGSYLKENVVGAFCLVVPQDN